MDRKLRLETAKRLRLAMETDEERKARLEKMARVGHGEDGSYQVARVGHGDGLRKKSKTGEDGSYPHSLGWPWRQRKKEELDWNICQT